MKKDTFEKLRSRLDVEGFVYHFREIMEIKDSISLLLEELSESCEKDPERTADLLSSLEIEALYHLKYHIDELRKPFAILLERAYADLEEE